MELYWSGDRSVDREFDQDIRRSIDRGFSAISNCWKVFWELDQKVVIGKVFVLVALPLGYNRGIVAIQIYRTVKSSSPRHKEAY